MRTPNSNLFLLAPIVRMMIKKCEFEDENKVCQALDHMHHDPEHFLHHYYISQENCETYL